eukprot:CAMPEP_0178371604 /NCGR_PEP_ID=MMETSP0689_2-20121128/912_1 /TAXON_ID=160604 /ORGANISM="Amphidinium massartii, Strain CS-259" /LENGTH=1446 /DNA_ID=CAMNT_0019991479 /DNA_START=181 /DNA_END=4521 /DNA_ORIENTATION=+
MTLEGKAEIAAWNETCIWPDIKLFEQEFDSAYIEFKVYARNWFWRNFLIGKATLQLSSINRRKNHVYARKLLILRRDESTEVCGILDLTVFCLKQGEQAPSLSIQELPADEAEEDEDELADLTKAVLSTDVKVPAGRPHHLFVRIHKVADLPLIGGGKPSPFVTVEFNGCTLSTNAGRSVTEHTYNMIARIPVMTPVYEDTILVKLWSSNFFSPDELLAQGTFSFSELRNNTLPPRWFNLYGWDQGEVGDITTIAEAGETVKENFFKGRLLMDASVARVPDDEEMLPAKMLGNSRQAEEPATRQVALLADVYCVTGAEGRTVRVELSFGSQRISTRPQTMDWGQEKDLLLASSDAVEEDDATGTPEDVNMFKFSSLAGRMEPLLVMTPEDDKSQPDVMVSVYSAGYISGEQRIGFCRHKLTSFPAYEPGNPSKPKFLALDPMPWNATNRNTANVLITIERHSTSDIVRHNRKNVKPILYILRAYCFMGRNIYATADDPGNYQLRVACAGVSKTTKPKTKVRPMWMECLTLKVVLNSDTPKEPPTMQPILVTLCEGGAIGSFDIGKAVCEYNYLRQKDSLNRWEGYRLKPQWISVKGGGYGGKNTGEVLIAFELLQWKHREEVALAPKNMHPLPWDSPEEYDPTKHVCRMRQATLHVSLLGLRDMIPLPVFAALTSQSVSQPKVVVKLEVMGDDTDEDDFTSSSSSRKPPPQIEFTYKETVEGEDPRLKENRMLIWQSKSPKHGLMQNFEMLQVDKMNIAIPDGMIFEPCILVQVYEQAYDYKLIGKLSKDTLIGETRITLADLLPCCWLEGVDINKGYDEQREVIEQALTKAREDAKVRDRFIEESPAERRALRTEERERAKKSGVKEMQKDLIHKDEEKPEKVNAEAKPLELVNSKRERQQLDLRDIKKLNIRRERSISPREGENDIKGQTTGGRPVLPCAAEDHDHEPFTSDFFFRGRPLLKNSDILRGGALKFDYNYQPARTRGFIKMTCKVTDGWFDRDMEEESDEEREVNPQHRGTALAVQEEQEKDTSDEDKLKRSFDFDDALDKYAFDKKKFVEHYKSPSNLPSRIRVRIYIEKAVCIFSKGTSYADPYIAFQLGPNFEYSSRNMFQAATNTPEFYRMEEKDMEFPTDSRLEVSIMDMNDFALRDELIGSTTVDLEDRWFSKTWRKANDKGTSQNQVPKESRSLYTNDYPGVNRGNIEMWVEMCDSVAASDTPASVLQKPKDVPTAIRIVIMSTHDISIPNGESVNIMVSSTIDCKEYQGSYKYQETDVHYTSEDGYGIFDWRIVYEDIAPTKSCSIQFQVYDYGPLLGNTWIGEVSVDMRRYLEKVRKNLERIVVGPQELPLHAGVGEERETVGSLKVLIQVMTQVEAAEKPAGLGREPPNEDPMLVCPKLGRDWDTFLSGLGFQLPDLGLWKKLIPLFISIAVFLVSTIMLRQLGLL